MRIGELLGAFARRLDEAREGAGTQDADRPLPITRGRLVSSAGTLHLYEFEGAEARGIPEDVPVTILPENLEPTEGVVVGVRDHLLLVQTFDALGPSLGAGTIVPDTAGFHETVSKRLAAMGRHPEHYTLGPAERLVPWIDPNLRAGQDAARASAAGAVLTPLWGDDLPTRRARLIGLATELVRANKRLLVIAPSHAAADDLLGGLAKALRARNLQYRSLLSRYEMTLLPQASGLALGDLGFEAQMHHFYARSRSDKASLRKKYERFRELTPFLAYKADKQRDLNEVKLLEWRLLTELADLQGKIKEIDETLAQYEQLPLWKRLTMQATGKNVESLEEYKRIYHEQSRVALGELDIAKARIKELTPEAAIPKDIQPEYEELKEEVIRLGGTKKIRELLAAGEGTNRQAFVQNKRLIVTTGARVATDPLFERVRFDVLLVDEAPRIPSPLLLAAAGLVRERIVLSADQREMPDAAEWASLERNAVGQPSR